MKRKIALSAGLALLLVLTYPALRHVGEVLARGKPGVWGMPTWYILLVVSYAILALTVLAQLVVFAVRTSFDWRQWTVLLIGLTAVRGLLYSSIAPPWQAPDEHAHFEYAALMAELGRVPTADDISQDLQQRIVLSMFEYDLWRLIKRDPVAAPPEGLLNHGGITEIPSTHVIDNRYLYYPQVGHDPPLYYVAPAIVYAAFPRVPTALQLYMMRLTTVVMFVGLMAAAIWATRQLFSDNVPVAAGALIVIAFHPMLAHIGSVLSSDILAAGIATALLGLLVTSLRDGLTWRRGAAVVVLLGVGLLVKTPALTWAIALVIIMTLLRLCRSHMWLRYAVPAAGLVTLCILVVLMQIPSGRARYWNPHPSPWGQTASDGAAYRGNHALRVVAASEEASLSQSLAKQTTLDLRGRPVSVAAWVRSESEAQRGWLAVEGLDGARTFGTEFVAVPEWQKVTLQLAVPDDALNLRIRLAAAPQSEVLFDQVTLLGASDQDVQFGWLRNGSGEQVASVGERVLVAAGSWIGVSGLTRRLIASGLENFGLLLRDRQAARWTFESFWGNFGAALVVPMPATGYRILAWACGFGAVGLGVFVFRALSRRHGDVPSWRRRSLVLLAGALTMIVVQMLVSLVAMYGAWGLQGRYFFPVVWPIGVLLALGWVELAPEKWRGWMLVPLTIGFVGLDCVALVRMGVHFYGP